MIRRADAAIAALGGLAVTIVLNPAATLYLGRRIPGALPDPIAESWLIAWLGHAALHNPAAFFQANSSWPDPDSLARMDSLFGYTPFALFAHGQTGVVLVYGFVFLLSTALAFAGAFLLGRAIGLGRPPALIVGIAFAAAPYRLSQYGHITMLSCGGVALALALLITGYRRSSLGFVVAGWAVAAWQMTLAIAVSLQMTYLLLVLLAGALIWVWRTKRPLPPRPLRLATIFGLTALAVIAIAIGRTYVRVQDSQPQAPSAGVKAFSSHPRSFLIAPGQSVLYRYRTPDARFNLSAPDEQSFFPGLTIFALALIGVVGGPGSRRQRLLLGLAALWLAYASLGVGFLHGYGGYDELRRLPGWSGIRVPGRLMDTTTLALALLAGLGAARLWQSFGRGEPRRMALLALLPVAIIAEGYGPAPTWVPLRPAVADSSLPAPVLHLPASELADPLYEFWTATQKFTPLVNGIGGTIVPPWVLQRYRATDSFPDARSVAYLRSFGVRTVVLHPWLTRFTPWQDAARRPVTGLGITRRRVGSDVIYELGVAAG